MRWSLKPIKRIECQYLFPYDFLYSLYLPLFDVPLSFSIPEANEHPERCFREIEKWWEKNDFAPEDLRCEIKAEGPVFSHVTVSGRLLEYNATSMKFIFDVASERDASSTFAYKILSCLAPLLEPEKWRGVGGGNVSFTGKIIKPFSIIIES